MLAGIKFFIFWTNPQKTSNVNTWKKIVTIRYYRVYQHYDNIRYTMLIWWIFMHLHVHMWQLHVYHILFHATFINTPELHAAVEEKACRVVELEQEVEAMEGELSAAQQTAKQAPSRTMPALVERLRNSWLWRRNSTGWVEDTKFVLFFV